MLSLSKGVDSLAVRPGNKKIDISIEVEEAITALTLVYKRLGMLSDKLRESEMVKADILKDKLIVFLQKNTK